LAIHLKQEKQFLHFSAFLKTFTELAEEDKFKAIMAGFLVLAIAKISLVLLSFRP
jgi:hypothetical protein